MVEIRVRQTENETLAQASKTDSWNLAHLQFGIVFVQMSLRAALHSVRGSLYWMSHCVVQALPSLWCTICTGLTLGTLETLDVASAACVRGDPCHLDGPRRGTREASSTSQAKHCETSQQLGTLRFATVILPVAAAACRLDKQGMDVAKM